MKLEQAGFRNLLKENTDDTKAIKADTAELLEAFYSSMFAAGNANFAKAQALKEQLEAVTTPEEVQSVTW